MIKNWRFHTFLRANFVAKGVSIINHIGEKNILWRKHIFTAVPQQASFANIKFTLSTEVVSVLT